MTVKKSSYKISYFNYTLKNYKDKYLKKNRKYKQMGKFHINFPLQITFVEMPHFPRVNTTLISYTSLTLLTLLLNYTSPMKFLCPIYAINYL